jgi:hypothetical protein
VLTLVLLLHGGQPAGAQDENQHYGPRPSAQAKSLKRDRAARKAHVDNPDVLVLPGLVANRKTRKVEVLAEHTGLEGETELEFLLVDQDSSHGYEALLWSYAKPSDVHQALEFIGLKPGASSNPASLRFGADGDLVNLSVRISGKAPIPIEKLVLDNETETTLPEDGFVFSGSIMDSAPDGEEIYVADVYDPRSVASIYNEPTAVLDVPRQANKGELYGRQVVNPAYELEHGTLLTIVMEPRGGAPRAAPVKVELALLYPPGASNVVFRLTGAESNVLAEAAAMVPILEQFKALSEAVVTPVISLAVDDECPVQAIVAPSAALAMMETMGFARMEPPVAGRLYYRAFVPQKAWMQAEGRPSQPWELHLRLRDGEIKGTMVLNEAVWGEADAPPTFTRRSLDVEKPADLRSRLDAHAEERLAAGKSALPGVLLVFAAPDVAYGALLGFLQPVLGTHGTVYVFVVND